MLARMAFSIKTLQNHKDTTISIKSLCITTVSKTIKNMTLHKDAQNNYTQQNNKKMALHKDAQHNYTQQNNK